VSQSGKTTMITTKDAPSAIGPYSQAVAGGGLVFVSGQLGLDPKSGEFAGEDLADQARQAMENMCAVLGAAGSDLNLVLCVEVYLTDMSRFADFNEIYAKYFPSHRPARAVIQAAALPKAAKVEVKCTALAG